MRILSGIQPSGGLHLGNLLGALRNWAALQEGNECFYCIVDLHAITVPQEPSQLRTNTLDAAAALLAAGIDPSRSVLFVQSHVPQHSELAWILGTITAFGELRRMTQFKEKAKGQVERVGVGLFTYPVLQAADILLYQADAVPVGADQKQHLELARDLAQRFNRIFGETFTIPEPYIPPAGARVMDLQDPHSKMSKSAPSPEGVIFLADPPEVLRRKIRRAVTDSGREIRRGPHKQAISNLIEIYSAVTGKPPEEIEAAYVGKGYAEFKADLAEAVVEFLRPFQEKYAELSQNRERLVETLAEGAARASAVAEKTMETVREKVGFLPLPQAIPESRQAPNK